MAFPLSSIQKGKRFEAPRLVFYGTHGIGKTTCAAGAPNPVFIPTEEGLGTIDTSSFPLATSSADVYAAIRTLMNEEHEYRTVIVDSFDWLERFVIAEIELEYDEKARSYGKDVILVEQRVKMILDALSQLRSKGITVILIAHQEQKLVKNPETEPYERYQPKLGKRVSELVQEWADAVLFFSLKVLIKQDSLGHDKSRARGVGTNKRVAYTQETPAHLAKNRYHMDPELPIVWQSIQDAIAASAA